MARGGSGAVLVPERNLNGSAARGARITPPKGRKRRPALAVILLAAAAGGALIGVTLVSSATAQTPVLALARDVGPGQAITPEDLRTVRVSADPSLRPVRASAKDAVIGRTAKSSLGAGTLLSDSQLGERPAPRPGEAVVGLALKPGRYPSGLRVGDRVIVVVDAAATDAAKPDATPRLGSSLSEARVVSVRAAAAGSSGSAAAMVSVVVPDGVGASVAGAAAADRVSLILIPPAA